MRSLPTVVIALSAVNLVVLACGGGSGSTSGGGSGSGTTQSAQSYCDAREQRSKQCAPDGSTSPAFDRTSCARDFDCILATLQSPDPYFSCRTNTDCNASVGDDGCKTKSAGTRTVPLSDTCAKKYAECKSAGGKGFDDDVCPIINAFNDGINAKLATCFDKPCDQIDDCLEASYEAAAPSCK